MLTRQVQDVPSGGVLPNAFRLAAAQGVVNDVALGPSGELVRRIVPPIIYRGALVQHAVLFMTDETATTCLDQTQVLPPDLTRIDISVPAE